MDTAIQLYSLRSLDEPLEETLARVADAGLDGAEFAGTGDASPTELRATLDEQGLAAAGAHVPIEVIEDDVADIVRTCTLLGTDTLVVPILDADRFADADAVAETATMLSELAERVADDGLRLAYHNHELEFVAVDGDGAGDGEESETAFERLVETTEGVDFELDVGWAHAAGADPVALIEQYGERISRVHLKDVAVDAAAERGGRPVDLGVGDVPLVECAEAARAADVDWAVFEHDAPEDPVAFVESAGEWSDRV
ncbi:Sugar phosphate isomerase/epimerase [Halogranum gelatinilyticum]|uniref:Sugar phosphate isomerase/epimerase n=1 Tax=Halogranum gelatinilyticum TaxID=660521 RepID=A0A1G9TUJ4_9EURY|nr:sugar phosphate isomerase/epimerase [Halogranum gelatinilyticum]SDM51399.1 Sugar phosphate isomerase/epimerase [Halogranum gelatinilyticum]